MSAGSFQDLITAWGHNESGNNYGYVSSMGFLGRYQFSEEGLMAIGWYGGDSNYQKMDFVGSWTGKAASYGVTSKASFLANTAAQDAAITQWFDYLVSDIVRLGMTQYLGQTLNGVPITMSGMLTGGSLVGVWSLKSYLESGGTSGGSDWYGTNVAEYVSRFAGYDTPYNHLGPAPTGGVQPPSGSGPVPAPVSGEGMVLNSTGTKATLTGGSGNDTIHASQGYDVLTGGAGADRFVFGKEPWAPITIKDFAVGADRLDFSGLFQAAGYTGSDPVGAKYVHFQADGSNTLVLFDRDGTGGGQQYPNYILKLEGVQTSGLTWGQLSGTQTTTPVSPPPPPPPPPSGTTGVVLNSPGTWANLTGGSGNDTIHASQGYDVLTGGAGADRFVFAKEPWAPITIKDFAVGTDRLDFSALFQASGYTGSDPVGAKFVHFQADGANTLVLFDRDGTGGGQQYPNYILKLEGVQTSGLTWGQLSGGQSTTPVSPPPPPPPPSGTAGVVLTSSAAGSKLVGGGGNDTLNASQGFDVLTGGGGSDMFVFGKEPWAPIQITDFTRGADRIDLRGLFDAAGYTGNDPVRDGYMRLQSDGLGNTQVLFDRDAGGSNPVWPNYIIKIDGHAPSSFTASDWIFQ